MNPRDKNRDQGSGIRDQQGFRIQKLVAVCFALVFLWAGLASAAPKADVLDVFMDSSETVRLPAPAATVSIANPDIADVQVLSPTNITVFGKGIGQTTLTALGANNQVLLTRRVRVGRDVSDIEDAIRTLLPDEQIAVAAMPEGLVLQGRVSDPKAAEDAQRVALRYLGKGGEVINRLKVTSSNQVQLRVRVAEVSRTVGRDFGINWANGFKVSGFAIGLATGAVSSTRGFLGLNTTRPGDNNGIISFRSQQGDRDVNGFIDALAKDGLITILAEPNLTALSGETAYFLVGGEYPILIPQGNGTISIEYKDYGIKLAFTPTLLSENRINLKVKPEVSELSDAGAVTLNNTKVPALQVRRAETTVEVGSGQSFAIAGLMSNSQNQNVRKYPFLGDIPVLGSLFRSTKFQNDQSELVIVITPYVVRPVSEDQIALPTDGYAPPSEFDRLILNRQSARDDSAKTVSGAPVAIPLRDPNGKKTDPVMTSSGFVVE